MLKRAGFASDSEDENDREMHVKPGNAVSTEIGSPAESSGESGSEGDDDDDEEGGETQRKEEDNSWPCRCRVCPHCLLLNTRMMEQHLASKQHRKRLNQWQSADASISSLIVPSKFLDAAHGTRSEMLTNSANTNEAETHAERLQRVRSLVYRSESDAQPSYDADATDHTVDAPANSTCAARQKRRRTGSRSSRGGQKRKRKKARGTPFQRANQPADGAHLGQIQTEQARGKESTS